MQTLKNHNMDAGFALKKAFIANQSQHKKLGNFFFIYLFLSNRPNLQILEKICAPRN